MEQESAYALDKISLAALRKADTVVFRHGERNVIEAIKKARVSERDPFAPEQRYPIIVDSGVTDYGSEDDNYVRPASYRAFYMVHSAQYAPEWRTIVNLLRAGDELRLAWRAGNNTGYLRSAGLHHDQLMLHVNRGKTRMVFEVGDSITPENSARMVRDAKYA